MAGRIGLTGGRGPGSGPTSRRIVLGCPVWWSCSLLGLVSRVIQVAARTQVPLVRCNPRVRSRLRLIAAARFANQALFLTTPR